jgi:DNA (cytosine-5)-methyltransferase 1
MKYLSVCSGIEAATVAWHHLGWKPVGFAEIEKFPQQVLAHHYPDVPNFQDLTQHDKWPLERGAVDLLVGGTPCQAFSIAGLRRGMDDERGQLTLEFVRLAARLRPRWIVWENVPGVLSSGGGRDFGSFLGALAQLGYGFAYRVLDAQYFGVAQRRRRVFVVGYLGDWRCAAAVLFERESLRGNPPPRSKAQQETSSSARSGLASSDANVVGAIDCRVNAQRAQNAVAGHLIPAWPAIKACTSVARSEESREQDDVVIGTITARMFNALGVRDIESGALLAVASGRQHAAKWPAEIACTLNARYGDKQGLEDQHALGGASLFVPAVGTERIVGFNARQDPVQYGNQSGAVDTDGHTMAVALGTDCYNGSVTGDVAATIGTPGSSVNASGPTVMVQQPSVTHTLRGRGFNASEDGTGRGTPLVSQTSGMQVRRLTPVECERLQGFPDGYTDIRPRGKDTPDGPRYKALGNSMAVPVMRWIGERVNLVDSLKRSR